MSIALLLALAFTAISYWYLDAGIARFAFRILNSSDQLLQVATGIPDLLLHVVMTVTALSWVGYAILVRRGIRNNLTDFLWVCGMVVPLAFIAKTAIQYIFGRLNPLDWLLSRASEPPVFVWFQSKDGYGCFPSGHMTVFTALMTTLSFYFPRYRHVCLGLLLLLAFALIITDHHFLSDVLAGAALGSVLAAVTIGFAPKSATNQTH